MTEYSRITVKKETADRLSELKEKRSWDEFLCSFLSKGVLKVEVDPGVGGCEYRFKYGEIDYTIGDAMGQLMRDHMAMVDLLHDLSKYSVRPVQRVVGGKSLDSLVLEFEDMVNRECAGLQLNTFAGKEKRSVFESCLKWWQSKLEGE